jgi:zinc protease
MMDDPAQFGIRLSESIASGDWRLLFLERDRIKAVTLADVQHVAETYFKQSNRTLGQFVPTEKPDRAVMPDPVDVAKLVADYHGSEAVAAGEAFDPSPANIDEHSLRADLPNGMQVTLLAKQTRGHTVAGVILLNTGTLEALAGRRIIPSVTATMLQRGTANLNRKEIADRREELKATISVAGGFDHVTVSFQTKRDKLPELLDLIADILRRPTFPEAELEQIKTERLASIDEQRHDPQSVAVNELNRHDDPYPAGDIRHSMTFDEELAVIKGIQVTDLKAYYDEFYGADHAQMALVGDFDPAAIEPQLSKLFGDWKAAGPYAHVPFPYHPSPAAEEQLETPDKANAFYIAELPIPLKGDDADFVPLILADHILGDGGLKSRIADRLRQKDGISYGAGSRLSESDYDANSSLTLYAIYAPQNLGKLKTDITEVLAAFLKDGATEKELAEAKSGLLQGWAISRTQDPSLAGLLAAHLKLGRTMAFTADREAKVKAVTLDQINGVIRKYLDVDHLVQIYAGDFAHSGKTAAAGSDGKSKD